tara:strand:+ start:240 stop:410 length:171 start_codon:yes stop_codon:yes gene_type:complete
MSAGGGPLNRIGCGKRDIKGGGGGMGGGPERNASLLPKVLRSFPYLPSAVAEDDEC